MRRCCSGQRGSGFTLVELLAVIGIVMLLGSLSIVGVQHMVRGGPVQAAQSLGTTLELARSQALTLNTYVRVGFAADPNNADNVLAAIFTAKKGSASSTAAADWRLAYPPAKLERVALVASGLADTASLSPNALAQLNGVRIGGRNLNFSHGILYGPDGVGTTDATGTLNRFVACDIQDKRTSKTAARVLVAVLSGSVDVDSNF